MRLVIVSCTAYVLSLWLGVAHAGVDILVEGTPLHGIQGLAVGPDGQLYAGAISAQEISRIDPETGAVELLVPAPDGEADDLAVGPDGTLYWTAIVAGELRMKRPGSAVEVLAANLPGINPVAVRDDGRVVAGQLGLANTLYEFDPSGRKPPRLISSQVDNLNSFEFGRDGRLYGPYWQSGKLVAIDIDGGAIEIVAEGLKTPSAISLDSQGQLVAVDYNSGEVTRTDPRTGKTQLLARLTPPLDNLAVGKNDQIYVSDTANSGIIVVDPGTGGMRHLVGGSFSTPGGLAVVDLGGAETLLVADSTGYRFVSPVDGSVARPPFDMQVGASLTIAANRAEIAIADPRIGRVYTVNRHTREITNSFMGLAQPYGVAITPDGVAYVSEYSTGHLLEIKGDKKKVLAKNLAGPIGVALGSESQVYVSDNPGGRILQVDRLTGKSKVVIEGLNRPEGIALLKPGVLAVAEVGGKRVLSANVVTGEIKVLAGDLPIGGVAAVGTPPEIGVMTGVAVGRDGAVYISCDGDNSIRRIPSGQ